ncbi:MAG: hypothetical protein NXI27_08480 [Alphaproteobacteria bacterium]|nr:hypothetical protein [Alphaproteobacteria bacterium]
MNPQVIITVNGPGEVSAWLYPLAKAVKRLRPDIKICVALLPCVFSTGAERQVVEDLNIADAVCDTDESWDLIFKNKMPAGFEKVPQGLIFHFGGEQFLTWLLSMRMGYELYAYVEEPFFLHSRFKKVFFSGLNPLPEKHVRDQSKLVGELMVDAATLRRSQNRRQTDSRKMVGLFPGSRENIVQYLLPFYAVIVDSISREHPDTNWVMAKADFISLDFLSDFPPLDDGRPLEAGRFHLRSDGEIHWLETENGNRIEISTNSDVLARADIALTIPGTNTGEIAASGIPMVLVLPTYWGETSPLPGLAGHVARIPFAGRYIKRALAHLTLRNLPYLAQPNRRSNEMIVPEIVGKVSSQQVHEALAGLLASDNSKMVEDLRAAMGQPGAADRLALEISDYLVGMQAKSTL